MVLIYLGHEQTCWQLGDEKAHSSASHGVQKNVLFAADTRHLLRHSIRRHGHSLALLPQILPGECQMFQKISNSQ
jgi:hypothetical protein